MSKTFNLPLVNGGEPFEVTPGSLTPRAIDAALVAKAHVLRTGIKELADDPDEIRGELREDLTNRAMMVQLQTMAWHIILRKDPSLKDRKAEVMEEMDLGTCKALAEAASPEDEDGAEAAGNSPLGSSP